MRIKLRRLPNPSKPCLLLEKKKVHLPISSYPWNLRITFPSIAGFSLFGNLAANGLDLDDFELEDEEVYIAPQPHDSSILKTQLETPPAPLPEVVRSHIASLRNKDEAIVFDPSIPLLFSIPPRLRDERGGGKKGGRPKDLFDVCLERGWSGGFLRTATEYVGSFVFISSKLTLCRIFRNQR